MIDLEHGGMSGPVLRPHFATAIRQKAKGSNVPFDQSCTDGQMSDPLILDVRFDDHDGSAPISHRGPLTFDCTASCIATCFGSCVITYDYVGRCPLC